MWLKYIFVVGGVCPFIDIQVASLLILLCDLSWTPRTKVMMDMSHHNIYSATWVNSPTLEKNNSIMWLS